MEVCGSMQMSKYYANIMQVAEHKSGKKKKNLKTPRLNQWAYWPKLRGKRST